MTVVKSVSRPYGRAAFVVGRHEEIKRLRLPEHNLHVGLHGLAARRIGGFRTEAEVMRWCSLHRYFYAGDTRVEVYELHGLC